MRRHALITSIARNVYLFSFLAEHSDKILKPCGEGLITSLWNTYYHFLLAESDLQLLQNHTRALASYSASLTAWQRSPFGALIDITSETTLAALHRVWTIYAECKNLSKHGELGRDLWSQMQQAFSEGARTYGWNDSRSAGVHAHGAVKAIEFCHNHYWTQGVAVATDAAATDATPSFMNPSMSCSSADANVFTVPRRTSYLTGFHFPAACETASDRPVSETARSITQAAKLEFAEWCKDFSRAVKLNRIHLIVHCGEALRFAHELQSLQSQATALPKVFRIYTGQHSGQVLKTCPASRQKLTSLFHVIDTSNLTDHVGLLAILPAVTPLLHTTSASTLYTETLKAKDDADDSSLQEMLGADPITAAATLGVIPIGLVKGFTTDMALADTSGHEDSYTMRCRFSWRLITSTQLGVAGRCNASAACQPGALSALLLCWYKLMQNTEPNAFYHGGSDPTRESYKGMRYNIGYYSQLSFVALLRYVRLRIETNWASCISSLVQSIHEYHVQHSLQHSAEELTILLHISGLREIRPLEPTDIINCERHRAVQPVTITLPGLVKLVLVVPYIAWSGWLKRRLWSGMSNPLILRISDDDSTDNHHGTLDAFFGTMKTKEGMDPAQLTLDPAGWAGASDLIIACNIRSAVLKPSAGSQLRVALFPFCVNVNAISLNKQRYVNSTKLFDASIQDQQYVHFLQSSPDGSIAIESGFCPLPTTQIQMPNAGEWKLNMGLKSNGLLSTLTMTKPIPELRPPGETGSEQVAMDFVSPSEVCLRTHGRVYHAAFPCPVKNIHSEIQAVVGIAYLIITATPVNVKLSAGCGLRIFSVQAHDSQFTPTSLGRIALTKQPLVSSAVAEKSFSGALLLSKGFTGFGIGGVEPIPDIDWISKVIGDMIMIYSVRKIFEKTPQPIAVKFMFNGAAELTIHPLAVRYDIHGGSLILDAIVTPMTMELLTVQRDTSQDAGLVHASVAFNVATPKRLAMLKDFVTASVERCRQGWKHGKHCEYKAKGATIPLTHRPFVKMLCSCGKGQNTEDFPAGYSEFKRISYRAAFSPLYPASEYEATVPWDRVNNGPLADKIRALSAHAGCGQCGKTSDQLKACAGCKAVKYCNKDCQKAGWKKHKQFCRQAKGSATK